MIGKLFGSVNKERILLFIFARNEGYASEMAKFWNCSLMPIQKQLSNLETIGALSSKNVGRTVVYEFNFRYFLLKELKAMIEKVLSAYPPAIQEKLKMVRKKPRLKGKPVVYLKDIRKDKKDA
jgi:hypothetical protein